MKEPSEIFLLSRLKYVNVRGGKEKLPNFVAVHSLKKLQPLLKSAYLFAPEAIDVTFLAL